MDQTNKSGRVPRPPAMLNAQDSTLAVCVTDAALKSIQDRVHAILGPSDGHEVDRFIVERRAEAARENR